MTNFFSLKNFSYLIYNIMTCHTFFFIYNEDKNGLDKKAGRRDKAALESAESAAAVKRAAAARRPA